jgi:hypothetical protein
MAYRGFAAVVSSVVSSAALAASFLSRSQCVSIFFEVDEHSVEGRDVLLAGLLRPGVRGPPRCVQLRARRHGVHARDEVCHLALGHRERGDRNGPRLVELVPGCVRVLRQRLAVQSRQAGEVQRGVRLDGRRARTGLRDDHLQMAEGLDLLQHKVPGWKSAPAGSRLRLGARSARLTTKTKPNCQTREGEGRTQHMNVPK